MQLKSYCSLIIDMNGLTQRQRIKERLPSKREVSLLAIQNLQKNDKINTCMTVYSSIQHSDKPDHKAKVSTKWNIFLLLGNPSKNTPQKISSYVSKFPAWRKSRNSKRLELADYSKKWTRISTVKEKIPNLHINKSYVDSPRICW